MIVGFKERKQKAFCFYNFNEFQSKNNNPNVILRRSLIQSFTIVSSSSPLIISS